MCFNGSVSTQKLLPPSNVSLWRLQTEHIWSISNASLGCDFSAQLYVPVCLFLPQSYVGCLLWSGPLNSSLSDLCTAVGESTCCTVDALFPLQPVPLHPHLPTPFSCRLQRCSLEKPSRILNLTANPGWCKTKCCTKATAWVEEERRRKLGLLFGAIFWSRRLLLPRLRPMQSFTFIKMILYVFLGRTVKGFYTTLRMKTF